MDTNVLGRLFCSFGLFILFVAATGLIVWLCSREKSDISGFAIVLSGAVILIALFNGILPRINFKSSAHSHHSNCSCSIEQQKQYCPICGSSDTETDSLAIHCNDCGSDLTIENESARAYFCPDCGSKAEFVAEDGDTVTLRCDDCGQERRIQT